MNILLVRHGETPWNRDGRYQGHTDIPLSPDGEAQARALGERLTSTKIDRAVASPLSRARRTAELVLGQRASMLTFDDGLKEISHGEWEGKLASEVELSHPELLHSWRSAPTTDLAAGPKAESLGQVEARAWAAMQRAVVGLHDSDTLLVVAHDAVNRAIICRVLGLPIERVWKFRQAPSTMNLLAGPSLEELAIVRLNDASHVAPLFAEATHRAL